MPKPTNTTQHSGLPKGIWVLRAKFDLGPLVIPSSNTMIRGSSRGILPGKILKCEVPEMAKSCILEVCMLTVTVYLCIFYCNSLFGPPLTEAPGKIAPSTPMGRGLDSTYSYNYLWQHSFIFTRLQKRNIFVLAIERQLRSDKPPRSSRGIHL